MLKYLRIKNFAIIDEVEMEFGTGLNIISGETGAGKSIIMDALFLILGGRASTDLIRRGATEATVEALFDISQHQTLLSELEEIGITTDEGEIIVKRTIQSSGKSRIHINGSMVTSSTLSLLTSQLVDLCSQHDQQILAKPDEQLLWLDRFATLDSTREKVKENFIQWKKLQLKLDALSSDSTLRTQRIDFLRFQIQELEEAQLQSSTEDSDIENELKILGNAENLFSFANDAEAAIYGADHEESDPILGKITQLLQQAKALSSSDSKLHEAVEFLNTLKVNTEELGFFLRSYQQKIYRNEEKLEELNARHALLTKLKRKYGSSLEEVFRSLHSFKAELAQLENHDTSLQEIQSEAEQALQTWNQNALSLSKLRKRAAKEFSRAVEKELSDLNMERARFDVSMNVRALPAAQGMDEVIFQIAANPGEPMGPLNKIASGGELSRVMLAMHNVVSSLGGVGVFLFDEVDTGIGGKTASIVGAKLQKVANSNQVICITHLPQVAAFASEHFHVEKSVLIKNKEERTVCFVNKLSSSERELELARMLGGLGNSKAALENARALLLTARTQQTKQNKETISPASANKTARKDSITSTSEKLLGKSIAKATANAKGSQTK